MGLDMSNEKDLFRYLGLLSNEVVQIQKTLQTIDAQESRLRAALDELALEKDILIEQAGRVGTIVKQTATSAVEDAEQECERQQRHESEKAALQTHIKEMEEMLQANAATVKDLEGQFTSKVEDLNGQIREKDSLLQIRDAVMKDLKAAAESLNRLVGGLSSGSDLPTASVGEPEDDPTSETADVLKQIEERTSLEIESLRNDIREKELALAAKSVELDMTKQNMGDRIKELEKALDARRKKKSPRLVSLLADMGGKRFM